MGIFDKVTGRDPAQKARRDEAKTRRKEASADKKHIQNKRMQQKLEDKKAKNTVRVKEGGTGFKFVFFQKRSKRRKAVRAKIKRGISGNMAKRKGKKGKKKKSCKG
jgi:hypothetical protein